MFSILKYMYWKWYNKTHRKDEIWKTICGFNDTIKWDGDGRGTVKYMYRRRTYDFTWHSKYTMGRAGVYNPSGSTDILRCLLVF